MTGYDVAVAEELGRDAILIDFDPVCITMQKQRISTRSLFAGRQKPMPDISDELPTEELPPAAHPSVESSPIVKQQSLWDDS